MNYLDTWNVKDSYTAEGAATLQLQHKETAAEMKIQFWYNDRKEQDFWSCDVEKPFHIFVQICDPIQVQDLVNTEAGRMSAAKETIAPIAIAAAVKAFQYRADKMQRDAEQATKTANIFKALTNKIQL